MNGHFLICQTSLQLRKPYQNQHDLKICTTPLVEDKENPVVSKSDLFYQGGVGLRDTGSDLRKVPRHHFPPEALQVEELPSPNLGGHSRALQHPQVL